MGRDSNSRPPFESDGFQDRCFRPLSHPSVAYKLPARTHSVKKDILKNTPFYAGRQQSRPTRNEMVYYLHMKRISWQTPEYVFRERTPDWFWTLGIIAAASAVTSIIFGNILFAIIIVIGAFAIALHSSREPRIIKIEINERGIAVGRDVYLFRSIHSFWIDDEHHDGMRLVLRSERAFAPLVMLPLANDTDVSSVREHLKHHIKEEVHEETLSSKIIDRFGF